MKDYIIVARKVIHFKTRGYLDFVCPKCKTNQDRERNSCWYCNTAFVFDDEVRKKTHIPKIVNKVYTSERRNQNKRRRSG